MKTAAKGLKDHQIAQLSNKLTAMIEPHVSFQCLRGMISGEIVKYLEDNDLRIDKPQ